MSKVDLHWLSAKWHFELTNAQPYEFKPAAVHAVEGGTYVVQLFLEES